MDLSKDLLSELHKKETPFFIFDLDKIRSKVDLLKKTIRPDKIFYAVKSNSLSPIISTLWDTGCGFEVNNIGEFEKVRKIGATTDKIINSSPITSAADVRSLYAEGVREFCFDTKSKIDNLAYNAPGVDVYIRIYNENNESRFKLNRLGVHTKDAPGLIKYAKEKGLKPTGVTFHAGSQCCNVENWDEGIYLASLLFEKFPELKHLNIGGGLPVAYSNETPDFNSIAETINNSIKKYFPEKPEIRIEPGRFLVGDCASTWTSVIQVEEKEEISRAVIDMSIFLGLIEILENKNAFQYPMLTDKNEALRRYQVEGCTCAGTDIISEDTMLPRLHVDYINPFESSRLILQNTGAYTLDYIGKNQGNGFNGAQAPAVYYIEGGKIV